MAEIWGAAIIAGGALASGYMQGEAAKDAAEAGNAGANAGIAEQRRQSDIFQGNIAPYLNLGQNAVGQLNSLNAGNYAGFLQSPDYLAAKQIGTEQLDAGATAGGNLWGGGADADRMAFGDALATQHLGNYRNALTGAVSLGQNAAVGAGSLGQQSANQIGGLYGNIGQNNANASINQANAWGSAIGGVANAAGQFMGGRQSSYAAPVAQGAAQQPWYGNNYNQAGW